MASSHTPLQFKLARLRLAIIKDQQIRLMKRFPLIPDQMCDMAITVLRLTNDGDKLAPQDLKLVELAVNGRLNETGQALFQALYQNATKTGGYTEPYLFGIEHLTIDHYGVIRWRSTPVEHFDHAVWQRPGWRDRMRQDAESVAACCRSLEARGIQPTAPLVLNELVPPKQAPQVEES